MPDSSKVVANQPHDEEVALSDDDDGGMDHGQTPQAMPPQTMNMQGQASPPNLSDDERNSDDMDSPAAMPSKMMGKPDTMEKGDDDESMGAKGGGMEGISVGVYNPEDYAHLQVSDEISELFQYIGRYKPQNHQLETKLKPFIPDYIPAVGDIDEFIKVARPDGKADELGLKVLDEPAAKQSDPTVLNLQLRAVSKQANLKPIEVTALDGADKNPRKIANWVQSIQDLHKNKPRPQVSYTKNMPDIETLMQEWPPELEEMLKHINLPDENLELNMHDYIKVMCNILDIPVYQNPIESLHVMLTLYLEFKNNPFLAKGAQGGGAPVGMAGMGSQGQIFLNQ